MAGRVRLHPFGADAGAREARGAGGGKLGGVAPRGMLWAAAAVLTVSSAAALVHDIPGVWSSERLPGPLGYSGELAEYSLPGGSAAGPDGAVLGSPNPTRAGVEGGGEGRVGSEALVFVCNCARCETLVRRLLRRQGEIEARRLHIVLAASFSPEEAGGFRKATGWRGELLFDREGRSATAYNVTRCPVIRLAGAAAPQRAGPWIRIESDRAAPDLTAAADGMIDRLCRFTERASGRVDLRTRTHAGLWR